MSLPTIAIYTDGGCHPNPGPGGWAAILLDLEHDQPLELVGKEHHTTNNRMELRAAAEALRSLDKPHQVTLYTDSRYLRQGINEWLPQWKARNWQTSDKKAVKNQDLWELLARQQERHEITWKWVKGHAGNKWNERADELATSQIPKPPLPLDDEQAVHLFTAAAYSGKSKRGGWAVALRYQGHRKLFSGQVEKTSSNRMHIQAAVSGLEGLKRPLPVHLYTHSDYLRDGATRWVKGWAARDWKTKEGKAVSHQDLWERLTDLTTRYQVSWHVVSKIDIPELMIEAKQAATSMVHSELE